MQFKLGDFVRFVDEKREGYVTRIIDSLTLGVTDTDGFEIPVAISNLTSVYGHQSNLAKPAEFAPIPEHVDETFVDEGIFIGVVESQKASSVVHFSLINRSSYQLLLSVKTDLKGKYKGEFGGVVQAKGQTQWYSENLADLEIWPEFNFQVIFFTTANIKPKAPLVLNRKFRAKDFSVSKTLIPELNKFGWIIRLDEPLPLIDAQKLKESLFRGASEQIKVAIPAAEIDLHIEKLRDDYQFLDQTEIINIQLAYFQQMLDAAIVHQLPKIVFIHGVGNGTLRHHIHKVISKHPQVRTFMDAQKEKFGFGATEVVFKV
ncbi:MAG: DNA mismatch repair protein MutS [Sphingobacteriales bacterium]|nr:MAG: DNA mismatch repair protein MutS [Sphingobacteriales bacterium]